MQQEPTRCRSENGQANGGAVLPLRLPRPFNEGDYLQCLRNVKGRLLSLKHLHKSLEQFAMNEASDDGRLPSVFFANDDETIGISAIADASYPPNMTVFPLTHDDFTPSSWCCPRRHNFRSINLLLFWDVNVIKSPRKLNSVRGVHIHNANPHCFTHISHAPRYQNFTTLSLC